MKFDRKAIVVIGDSMSDFDGVGTLGYGEGRWHQAIWTRELSFQIDPDDWSKNNRGALLKKYRVFRSFHLLEGGDTSGGSEFAISGSTSLQNLGRLKGVLKKTSPGLVVIAGTGYNDFRNKISIADTIKHINAMIDLAKGAGSQVLLIGFPPRILGAQDRLSVFEQKVVNALKQIAVAKKVALVEDYFAPVRDKSGVVSKIYLADKIHLKSNRLVQQKLLEHVMRGMEPLLKSLAPVVLDLTGEGLQFRSLGQSSAWFDADHDGRRDAVAWVGRGMGVLAFDKQGDGRVTDTDEISFLSYKPGARTDLEGLQAFDSNGDGKLSKGDLNWRKFVVWIDGNGDGISDAEEVKALDDLGIETISLVSDQKPERLDGVTIHGKTTFMMANGSKRAVGDVSFDYISSSEEPAISARVLALRHVMAGVSGQGGAAQLPLSSFQSSGAAELRLAASR